MFEVCESAEAGEFLLLIQQSCRFHHAAPETSLKTEELMEADRVMQLAPLV